MHFKQYWPLKFTFCNAINQTMCSIYQVMETEWLVSMDIFFFFLQHRHGVNAISKWGPSHAPCSYTWSCCCLASSICCLCFSICEAASFFCSSWAAKSCSLRLLNWPIMPMSWRSFSARLSGVPKGQEWRRGGNRGQRWYEISSTLLRLPRGFWNSTSSF